MKIRIGPMWWDMRRRKKPWPQFAYLSISLAILGVMIAPSVVVWFPARLWPNEMIVVGTFGILGFLFLRSGFRVSQRATNKRELVIEEIAGLLGFLFAIMLGIGVYVFEGGEWSDRNSTERKETQAEQGGETDS